MNGSLTYLGIAAALALGLAPASAQSPAVRPALAVLPLVSAEAAQDFFADGMTDEIAAALAGLRGLDFVARTSAFSFKRSDRDIATIGRELHASYLVQGTARLTDGRVRVDVRLVRANDGAALWSENFDTGRADIFDLEKSIAEGIARALKLADEGGPPVRSRTRDIDAYLDYLRAKTVARARGAKPLADAAAILETVVMRTPDFAPAAALLAYDYALTPLFSPALRGGLADEERKIVARTVPRSQALAQRATALDPTDADGFVALAYANMVQRQMVAAETAFRQALALNPNHADGLHGLSQLLAAMGRIKESLAMRERLQASEPFVTNYTADTAEIYWLDGDTEKALAMLQPFRPGRTLELALIEAAAGRYREAAAAIREMPAANYPAGMTEDAAKLLESAPAQAAAPASLPRLGSMSFAYMHVGAPERVLEYYEDEISAGYFQPISATWFWHPTYAAVRRTERFKTVVRDLGLVDYWRARGWPAQCKPSGATDFSCE